MLIDFYQGETKKFEVQIKKNDVIQDISDDEVWFYMKSKITDTDYIMSQSADLTSGSNGVASFELTPTMTDLAAGIYPYEISWIVSGSDREYVLDSTTVKIKQRVENQ